MRSSVIVVFALVVLAGPMLEASEDRVVARKKRIDLLEAGQSALGPMDPQLLEAIENVRYPFEFKPEEEPVAVVEPTQPAPELPRELTDQEVLEQVAERIQPTGMLFVSGKGVLILSGARQLPDGSAIRVNLDGKSVMIRVNKITSDSYELQLNEATLLRRFDENINRGVTRDR